MQVLLNFVLGGGLLALVQAVLTAWNTVQAKRAGELEAANTAAAKVQADVSQEQDINGSVAVSSRSRIDNELRDFTRD